MASSGPCPDCGFDGDRLGPRDAAVALRSLPRRYRAVFARPDDEERHDDVLHRRPRDGGLSAIEHATWVATAVDEVAEALRLVLIQEDPTVVVAGVDPSGDGQDPDRSAEEAAAAIEAAVLALAGRAEATHGREWTRTGHTRDGSELTALDLLHQAVHVGVHHLRAADRTINQVARELPS